MRVKYKQHSHLKAGDRVRTESVAELVEYGIRNTQGIENQIRKTAEIVAALVQQAVDSNNMSLDILKRVCDLPGYDHELVPNEPDLF